MGKRRRFRNRGKRKEQGWFARRLKFMATRSAKKWHQAAMKALGHEGSISIVRMGDGVVRFRAVGTLGEVLPSQNLPKGMTGLTNYVKAETA